MNKTTKLILGFVAGAIVLCLAVVAGGLLIVRTTGWALGRVFKTDVEQVAVISSSIAEYTVPAGFGNPYAVQAVGYSLVAYTGADGHSHIFLFQLPGDVRVDQAEIERQLRQATGSGDQPTDIVNLVPATVCGQDTTLVVSEGVSSAGQPFRQVSGMFSGKGGQALVVFETPVSTWNQAEVDAFIASIQ